MSPNEPPSPGRLPTTTDAVGLSTPDSAMEKPRAQTDPNTAATSDLTLLENKYDNEKRAPSNGFSLFRKEKSKEDVVVAVDDNDKKKKDGEDKIKPVGILSMFRFATGWEIAANLFGLFLAILAGAGNPVMTLFFGNITKSFTEYGIVYKEIMGGQAGPEAHNALEAAKRRLKDDASPMALWITLIGGLSHSGSR
jgi:ATP-binding cassette subfamily B (MDR/TAP) protein 1